MKPSILCVLLLSTLGSSALAQQSEPSSFVTDAIDQTKVRHGRTSLVGLDLTPTCRSGFGHFDVSVSADEWNAFARSTKEEIRSRIADAGWRIDVDVRTEPTGKVPFDITIKASKNEQRLFLNAVIFLSQEGVVHVVYSVQHAH